jgi:hypothetical protein
VSRRTQADQHSADFERRRLVVRVPPKHCMSVVALEVFGAPYAQPRVTKPKKASRARHSR